MVADIKGSSCHLTGANVSSSADLTEAILYEVDLTGANLSNTFLYSTNLTNANLTGSNLEDAILSGVLWSNTTCPDGSNSDTNGLNACVP